MKVQHENFREPRPPQAQPMMVRAHGNLTNFFSSGCAPSSVRGRPKRQPRRLRSPFALIAFILFFAGNLFASDVAAEFSAANRLYAQGKFSDAAAAYEKMLQGGALSPALLFNEGNAEFKSGHLGNAIAAYQQAAQFSPRDAELRANLAFVRNQVQGATQHESRRKNAAGWLTLNESTLLAMTFLWLTFLIFIIRQLHPALTAKLQGVTRILVVLAIISALILIVRASAYFTNASAVVVADSVIARSGPFDDAQSAFTVRDGAELSVLDQREGWIQVTDGTGKSGWVPAKQVKILRGA